MRRLRSAFPHWQGAVNSPQGYRALTLALTALIAWRVWFAIVPAWQLAPSGNVQQSAPAVMPMPEKQDFASLPLFGPVQNAPSSPFSTQLLHAQDPGIFYAPRSALPLRVTGLVIGAGEQQSMAIIEHNARQASYLQGDLLLDGQARLVRLFPDRVIIDHQGNYESLLFP